MEHLAREVGHVVRAVGAQDWHEMMAAEDSSQAETASPPLGDRVEVLVPVVIEADHDEDVAADPELVLWVSVKNWTGLVAAALVSSHAQSDSRVDEAICDLAGKVAGDLADAVVEMPLAEEIRVAGIDFEDLRAQTVAQTGAGFSN